MKNDKIIGPKAYINLDKCRSNLVAIKKSVGDKKLLCVVKANGYGHGSVQIAKSIANIKNVQFAVFSIDEALALRKAKIKNEIFHPRARTQPQNRTDPHQYITGRSP